MKSNSYAKLARLGHKSESYLPKSLAVRLSTNLRRNLIEKMKDDIPSENLRPPFILRDYMWGIKFQSPLMNTSGLYSDSQLYYLAVAQGAGGFLGGPSTFNARKGFRKSRIDINTGHRTYSSLELDNPFLYLPNSDISLSAGGLPNNGFLEANNVAKLDKKTGVPLGWSFAVDPSDRPSEKISNLVNTMWYFARRANIDFMEVQEPYAHRNDATAQPHLNRLDIILNYINYSFMKPFENDKRKKMPVVVKFSSDVDTDVIPEIIDLLLKHNFSGANFGGPSTNYNKIRQNIHPLDAPLFDYYVNNYHGQVSGKVIKNKALQNASIASDYLSFIKPDREFHIFREGGVDSLEDVELSKSTDIKINLWNTGFFNGFANHGHDVYKNLFESNVKA